MIKVAIFGADTPLAGELIRILAMHPEVEIVAAQASGLEGTPLSSVHHGLIGETDLDFTTSLDYSRCDVLFLARPIDPKTLEAVRAGRRDMRVIALPQSGLVAGQTVEATEEMSAADIEEAVFGVPEMNRKLMVRGAKFAVVPRPLESMALVALFPFASNLLLNSDVSIKFEAPQAVVEEADIEASAGEIERRLAELQKSFCGKVNVSAVVSEARRSAIMTLEFPSSLNLEQVLRLYDVYDDHRFSFVSPRAVGVSEVAGTNKCVIGVEIAPDNKVVLSLAADCRMRGGAGEAVHIMNLMFGLHEKTGLYLKAIDFDRY